jgi:hypothetical protein
MEWESVECSSEFKGGDQLIWIWHRSSLRKSNKFVSSCRFGRVVSAITTTTFEERAECSNCFGLGQLSRLFGLDFDNNNNEILAVVTIQEESLSLLVFGEEELVGNCQLHRRRRSSLSNWVRCDLWDVGYKTGGLS